MKTMYYNGNEYELAPKTMKIARLQETTEKSATMTEAYTNEHNFIKAVIGDAAAREILGTANLEEIDLNEMVLLYNKIVETYDREILEKERERELEAFASPAFDKISKLADDVRIISSIEKLGKNKK